MKPIIHQQTMGKDLLNQLKSPRPTAKVRPNQAKEVNTIKGEVIFMEPLQKGHQLPITIQKTQLIANRSTALVEVSQLVTKVL